MSYIGSKPANKPVVASDLDPTVITGQTALAVEPASTDEFLISDAGVLKRLDASLIGGGKVLQVVSNTITAPVTIGSLDTITSFISQAITPSATSSKVLIRCHGSYSYDDDDSFGHILLYKDSSILVRGDSVGSAYRSTQNASARTAGGLTHNVTRSFAFEYLDSPSSTSSISYSGRAVATNNVDMYIGRSGTTVDDNRSIDITTITLMEIGA